MQLCIKACACRSPSAAGCPQCVKQCGPHQSLPPPHGHCQAPRETCKSRARQREAHILPPARWSLRIRLPIGWPGNVPPKGRRHAGLSGCWGTSCHCKKPPPPSRTNITLTPWRALGGLPLQNEKQRSATTIKKQMITISLLERNKQAVCRERVSTDVDSFV